MNQILYTGKNSGQSSLKSILKFFSISLIAFGVIFIGKGSYALYRNYELSKEELENIVSEISFAQQENTAVITISNVRGVSKVKYHWNNDTDKIIQGNSEQTVVLDDIKISSGTNTLYITAIDTNGKATERNYSYSYDGISIEFPSVIDNTYLKILVSDVKGLSHITYRWNSDEAVTAYPEGEDTTVIEQLAEIPSGLNTLYVTAVNSENKTLTHSQRIKGNHPPKIELYIQDSELIVVVSDEEGIDRIIQQINVEEEKTISVGGNTEYTYRVPLENENNILATITAIDVEGISRTIRGK